MSVIAGSYLRARIGGLGGSKSCVSHAMDVMVDNACPRWRHFQPGTALQRALGVLVAALPMLAHRCAGELVILGVALIGLLLVDQMGDREVRQIAQLFHELAFLIGQP